MVAKSLGKYLLPLTVLTVITTLIVEKDVIPTENTSDAALDLASFVASATIKPQPLENLVDEGSLKSSATTRSQSLKSLAGTDACVEKQWAMGILLSAFGGSDVNVDEDLCQKLPTEEAVSAMYGKEPVVYGLDTCDLFRRNVEQATAKLGKPRSSPTVRVAGLYHTGTIALAYSIGGNMEHGNDGAEDPSRWEVPWKKHVPPRFRDESRFQFDGDLDLRTVLPIILVRDPFWWIQSMCANPHGARWMKSPDPAKCPDILSKKRSGTNKVTVKWDSKLRMEYASIVAVWNDWIREYYEADFPRLMIRFEDQLFHAEKVMEIISECAGVERVQPFRHPMPSKYLSSNDFITAMIQSGSEEGRKPGAKRRGERVRGPSQSAEWKYVQKNLDSQLMKVFHYKHNT